MPDSPRKAPFRCPHCGFVQHEPQHLISTYCRGCGSHYEVTPARRAEEIPPLPASARQERPVACYRCGRTHRVSRHARSTLCPGCNSAIEFGDLVFSSNVSRPIDTRGLLRVTPTGYLNNAFIVCGEGLIEGRISGTLRCEGTLRIGCSGRIGCRITAGSIHIEKAARLEITHPVKTSELIVYGHAAGYFECAGKVRIAKGGQLEGRLIARSVTVDRGGNLLAESSIQPRLAPEPLAPPRGLDGLDPLSAY
ncbi:MAG TPA: polymer-forming cytoskeletal protein [Terrimicrobiaceae bacterium]|nr:polymer-forming cytoskeletal protein [Terrimicrobiaceae bacterium]